MSNNKNAGRPEEPMLFEEEEKYYETPHGKKLFGSEKNRIIATNKRLLIFAGSGYKSLFYDKITSLNVRKDKIFEINLVGGKEPEVFSVGRKGALGLFDVVSRMVSVSNDARMAYAIGSIDAQKNVIAKQQAMVQEVGARHVMEYISEEVSSESATVTKQRMDAYAEDYSKKQMVSVNAKNSYGKRLDISFNFIPKIKDSIYNVMSSEALYTLTHSIYSRSSAVAGILYGNAKNAGVSLSATIASTIKQNAMEKIAQDAYAMKFVALSNISHSIVLEGDPSAYIEPNCFCFAALSIEEFTKNIYYEFGERLAGLYTETVEMVKAQKEEPLHAEVAGFGLLRKGQSNERDHVETQLGNETQKAAEAHKKSVEERILKNMIIFNARVLNEKKKNEKKVFGHFINAKEAD
ncbi:MAG: hypothetical protein QW814_01270 [Methanothrix sp.]